MKIRHLTYFIMLNFINQRAYFQRISYKFNEVLSLEDCENINGGFIVTIIAIGTVAGSVFACYELGYLLAMNSERLQESLLLK